MRILLHFLHMRKKEPDNFERVAIQFGEAITEFHAEMTLRARERGDPELAKASRELLAAMRSFVAKAERIVAEGDKGK